MVCVRPISGLGFRLRYVPENPIFGHPPDPSLKRDQHKKPGFKDLYKVYQNKRAMNNNKQEFQKKGAEKKYPINAILKSLI